MKVFVAGASGAIGRALVPQLVAAGHAVAAREACTPSSTTSPRRCATGCPPR
jgi:nucleoside-diphosphate-sugar epimerase